eukprot:3912487-Alexandrium_andersonii.AAC.1
MTMIGCNPSTWSDNTSTARPHTTTAHAHLEFHNRPEQHAIHPPLPPCPSPPVSLMLTKT